MKPIKIVMQAFGPYPGREEIDFGELSKAGIFLIKGPTGSGKTTIFDAMSMALYGKSTVEDDKSKTGRNKLEVWRCNQAKSSDETIVEFTFEANGSVYRFSRRLIPKRVKLDQVNSLCLLDENGIFQVLEENPKDSVLSAEAERIIGLNSNQFRQVVLLPQGQFERFLTADSSEKEQILSKLFDASQWERYATKIYEKAEARRKDLLDDKKSVESSLAEEKNSFESLEGLDAYICSMQEELGKLEEAHIAFNVAEKRARLDKDKSLYAKYERLQELKQNKKDLGDEADSIEFDRKKLFAADKAEIVREPIVEVERLQKDYHDRENALIDLKAKTGKLEQAEKNAKAELEQHKKHNISDECNKKIATLQLKREKYEKLDELNDNVVKTRETFESSKKTYDTCAKAFDEAKEDATKRLFERNEADAKVIEYRSKYYAGIYGEIATELVDDIPCPVCGSKSHPSPATRSADGVTKEAVEEAEKLADKAKKNWEKAEKERADAETEVRKAETKLKDAEATMNTAVHDYEENNKDLIDGVGSTEALDKLVEKLKGEIEQYKETTEKLEKKHADALADLGAHAAKIETGTKECEKARQSYNTKREILAGLLKENGYADIESARHDQLTSDERTDIRQRITAYETKVKTNASELTKQLELVEGTIEPDKTLFEIRQNEIDDEAQQFTQKQAELKNEIDRLSEKFKKLSKKNANYEANIVEAEADYLFAKSLRGDTGIGLQRYVLGIMFNQIIAEANRMLKMVHDGRYHLYRTDEKGSGNKRGLELLVKDNRAADGKGRPVTSLSGGEKFLVSLSLSIGMSTVAQKSGLHIEALFIDEGFGTLDGESISDAMYILEQVQKSSGMIGIISHVSVLENTIPKHIEIIKTNGGSHIKPC